MSFLGSYLWRQISLFSFGIAILSRMYFGGWHLYSRVRACVDLSFCLRSHLVSYSHSVTFAACRSNKMARKRSNWKQSRIVQPQFSDSQVRFDAHYVFRGGLEWILRPVLTLSKNLSSFSFFFSSSLSQPTNDVQNLVNNILEGDSLWYLDGIEFCCIDINLQWTGKNSRHLITSKNIDTKINK